MGKKNIFITLLVISLAFLVHAKDELIPNLSNEKTTIFDYNKVKLKTKSPPVETNNKVNMATPPNSQEANNNKPQDTSAKTTEQAVEAKSKKVEPPKIEFFNIVSLKNQSKIDCPVTPTVKNIDTNMPQKFQLTNNLRRYITSPEVSAGNVLYIKGKIQDINCTPIAGAVINLWQVDAYGNNNKQDNNFVGNGTSISDNSGNFSFITIFPAEALVRSGAKISNAPHINLRAQHEDFPVVNTKIYFPLAENINDVQLNSLSEFQQNLLIAELVPVEQNNLDYGYYMLFDITVNGISKYRSL